MQMPWEMLSYLESFFKLGFLFSGLEVSSTSVLLARMAVFLLFCAGIAWITFRIVMKVLECLQIFLGSIGSLPRSFFLLLLLAVPLSSDSIGAKWIGYLIVVGALIALSLVAATVLILWRYGVDQALRFVNTFMNRDETHRGPAGAGSTVAPAYNIRSETELAPPESDLSPRLSSG
jgi:hypothetical protein